MVKDTGIGIPEDHLDLIFEEFHQVNGDHQEKIAGTGLGLPLSKRLAELLGGSLSVESELGKGSTFTLCLSRIYSSEGNASASPHQIQNSEGVISA